MNHGKCEERKTVGVFVDGHENLVLGCTAFINENRDSYDGWPRVARPLVWFTSLVHNEPSIGLELFPVFEL